MKTPRLLAALLLFACPAALFADEVSDALDGALKHYQAGKLDEAAASLQNALNLINAKRTTSLSTVLPDEIKGWKGGKVESSSLDKIGGGSTLERDYRKDDKKAVVSIAADSPLLNQVAGFLKNPALGGLLGLKTRQVGDLTAMIQPKEGLLQMAVNDRYLVQIQGKKLTEEELATLAAGVKVEALKAVK